MLSKEQAASHTILILALARDGKLTDEFLPPDEFHLLKSVPYPQWPKPLKEKLSPWIPASWDNPELEEDEEEE